MNLENGSKNGKHGSVGKKVLTIVIAVVIVALLALSAFLWLKLHNNGEAEARRIQEQAGKVMVLPDEDALVSKVEKADEIRQQPFFANVENGDQVLIFVKAGKIVIFRPSENKIINAGPIINDGVGDSPSDSTPNETPASDDGDALEEE